MGGLLVTVRIRSNNASGRVFGSADYLSRHSSEIHGAKIQAQELWKDWFFNVKDVSNFTAISG